MALRKVKGTLERVLDKNLQDLVRGIRNHKENESKYIAECIDEIKQELKQENLAIKANAVNKLTYLQMLGYDISWAAFNIIEVMSSTKFTFKRIGYLAASQSFHEETDVLMLTTNMIRKDMSSQNMYDSGVALGGLACFITPDLARDLANDIMTLMTSSRPYLRKKAVLIMYKVFLQFPEALRPAFPRLKEKLEDPDPGVQSAAVNVICELARKNPKNYLSLAPLFFKLMTTSTNNWVLIKIIKLFSALTPLEPRLGKKLIEPLTNLIHSTSAMSLLYECINTVIAGIPNHTASIQLCVQKLRILIEDSDQNLKYLGLLAMSRILATHPKSVQGHKDLILQCLDDRDESIRLRALDLLYGMVSKKNLMEIVKKLMVHMDKAEGSHYRDELLSKTVEICSQSNYQYVTNFEWYVSILVELTRMEGTKHGKLIANQMLDVAIRVQAIRHFAVSQMALLLENSHILANNSHRNGICEVLYAAAWICGEFSEHLNNPKATLEAMLRPKITSLPGHIQSIFVQNILKLYGKILKAAEAKEDAELKAEVHQLLQDKLPVFMQSGDLEVQERACCILQIVKYIVKLEEKGAAVADEVEGLYAGELNPVAPKAQRKVPVPEGLDLDKWINEEPEESSDEEFAGPSFFLSADEQQHRSTYQYSNDVKTAYEPTEEELEKRREMRKTEVEHNPHYLKDTGKGKKKARAVETFDSKDIPVAAIDLSIPLHVPGMSASDKYMLLQQQAEQEKRLRRDKERNKKKKKKKGKKGQKDESDDDEIPVVHSVSTVVDAPEGANISDHEEDAKGNDQYKALDINLDEPLRDDEVLPVRTHHIVLDSPHADADEAGTSSTPHTNKESKKKSKKDKHKEEKGDKKKKKRKKSESRERGPSLLIAEEPDKAEAEPSVEVEDEESKQKKEKTKKKDKKAVKAEEPDEDKAADDDLSFWLSKDDAPQVATATTTTTNSVESPAAEDKPSDTVTTAVSNGLQDSPVAKPKLAVENVVLTSEDDEDAHSEEKQKKKKDKKSKKEREKDKKDKKKEKKKIKNRRSEYEEAEGITTPSKEIISLSQQHTPNDVKLPPMSSYLPLAENGTIKLTYETRINHQRSDQIVVSVVFCNLSKNMVKDLEFSVLDTLNTKLIRGIGQKSHDPIKVPFVLLPEAQNEGQFAFTIESIQVPQKLRGTLTYILKNDEGSTQDKVDFKINLPCSTYLGATPCSSEEFATLLSGTETSEKGSVKFSPSDAQMTQILAKTCFFLHFRVVEQIDNSASLFSRSIQGHPVCLLLKLAEGSLSIDGKSSDQSLLSNILEEAKILLTQPPPTELQQQLS